MRLFDAVREEATAYDVAVNYGLRPNRAKMICCPFHQDKHPSMKVDRRYYCFGCGAHGDAIDFVANLYGIGMKEAAIKIATDFHIFYDDKQPTSFEQSILVICQEIFEKDFDMFFLKKGALHHRS